MLNTTLEASLGFHGGS